MPAQKRKKTVLETLTVQELLIAERESGISINSLGDETAQGTLGLLLWLGYLQAKRKNLQLTFDEYASDKTLPELTEELGLNES